MPRQILLLAWLAGSLAAATPSPWLLGRDGTDKDLTKQIQKALTAPLVVITDKPQPSPSGNAHDYISYGRYYWPDPARPGGLPYVGRDGHPNRDQIALGDGKHFDTFLRQVEILALGWSLLHRADCAQRAGEWLRTWLVAPDTRLNPSFDYAQIRLGHDHNRGSTSGLIDTRGLAQLADAVRLLEDSPGLSPADDAAIKTWFSDYFTWLLTSPNGRKEHAAKNNHGSWYLAQAVTLARFLGRNADAKKLAEEDFSRIDSQINADGSQPLELARTDGLSYSVFNLEAQLELAIVAAPLGVDLWHYTAPQGGSLARALAFLRPYDAAPDTWPHAQLARTAPGFLHGCDASVARLEAGSVPPLQSPKQ